MNALKKTKSIVLVTDIATGEVETYNNLKAFTNKNKDYSYNTVSNYLSREGKPFQDEKLKIERRDIIK